MGVRKIIYLSLHCYHQNDFCIKMGSDESHFNVSVGSDGQSHKTVSTNHNLRDKLFFETYTGGGVRVWGGVGGGEGAGVVVEVELQIFVLEGKGLRK